MTPRLQSQFLAHLLGNRAMQKEFAIDIGTNSIRLLYAKMEQGKLHTVKKLVNTVRTGEGVNASGRLCEAAIRRTIQGISEFVRQAKQWGAKEVLAFATSAVRDAENGQEFVERVWQECGVRVQILQGEQEAICGITGALGGKEQGAIIDIGGGSTEIAVMRQGKLASADSINIGCVRGLELFAEEEYEKLIDWAKKSFLELNLQELPKLYGIGGTATALAAIDLGLEKYDPEKVDGHEIAAQRLEALMGEILRLSKQERIRRMCLDGGRAEVIVYGLAVLLGFCRAYHIPKIIVSEADNLEGYVLLKQKGKLS